MAASDSPTLRNLQNITRFSDLTLDCGDGSFKVHIATVCLHSPVMTTALTSKSIEAHTKKIKIPFDLPSVKRLIDFMYTGDYNLSYYTASVILSTAHVVDQISTMGGSGKKVVPIARAANTPNYDRPTFIYEKLICHGRVNAIADYYDIPALRALSTERTRGILESEWHDKHFCHFLRNFSGSTGDSKFHQMLGTIAMEHVDDILEDRLLEDTRVLREIKLRSTIAIGFSEGTQGIDKPN
ncbi:hypothetical protein GQX73_g9732 [Xylaria multiplex]|uniref:BTB domain-containing protein n=1 Tax=Xylaria multiplex TaxID=323545 RepID=A0A7C8IM30_9PEZI|nr:hypothetical protein GQX73_g9732 [Xylaria multiplex]